MSKVILASKSPRRRELLSLIFPSFEIETVNTDETIDLSMPPEKIVMSLAERKAEPVAEMFPDAMVIGADTIVWLDGEILGKPKDPEDARKMLSRLSGKTHAVYTGVALFHQGRKDSFFERTEVTFWEISEEEIDRYIETGEPLDKAGSYGIQGFGATFVKKINGDYYTVVGLPVSRLYQHIKLMGVGEENRIRQL